MEDKDFEKIIDKATSELPKEFRENLDNVELFTEDWPTDKQLNYFRKRGDMGMLLGLYQGVPQTKRRSYGVGMTLPDKITIFKIPILRISRDLRELIDNVKSVVEHELAHHFGMSEAEIRDIENSKKK